MARVTVNVDALVDPATLLVPALADLVADLDVTPEIEVEFQPSGEMSLAFTGPRGELAALCDRVCFGNHDELAELLGSIED